MAEARQLVADGDPEGALTLLQQQARKTPADARLRVFLFQLLCVLGRWDRALTQLQVCGELDAGTLAMVETYREAIRCERLREAVYAGRTTPLSFGEPQVWVATLAEALQADARGQAAVAARLRSDAFDAAPVTAGRLDGTPFDWIADADSRLGPVLEVIIDGRYGWLPFSTLARLAIEPPADLRDLVWAPARLTFVNGGQTVALLPTRYPGSTEAGGDDGGGLQLARRTEWRELAPRQYAGLGQRVIATSGPEAPLLEIREIVLGAAAEAAAPVAAQVAARSGALSAA